MAGTKISALTAAAALGGTEAIPGVQSAANVKITATQIKAFTSASPTLVTPVLGVATGTSLALGGATIGSNNPVLDMTQTWNNGAVAFTGAKLNVTDTASAAGSRLMDLQVGGVTQASLTKNGQLDVLGSLRTLGGNVRVATNSGLISIGTSSDVILARDAANVLALRNGTAAQAFNVYNTYTDASNYERGVFDWAGTANTLRIGTEAAGTGTVRNIQLVAGSNSVTMTVGASNLLTFNGPVTASGQLSAGTQVIAGSNVIAAGFVKTTATAVGSLPDAATAGAGARSFVTDATATTFMSVVAGGGANKVPVVSDGTNWLIG